MPVMAKLIFEEFKQLPPLPRSIFELSVDERVSWLRDQIDKNSEPVEIYRLQRQLFYEFYWTNQQQMATTLCQKNIPLREDFYYR